MSTKKIQKLKCLEIFLNDPFEEFDEKFHLLRSSLTIYFQVGTSIPPVHIKICNFIDFKFKIKRV